MIKVVRKAVGDPGLNEYGDNLSFSTESSLELQGRSGSLRYRQMSQDDPQIGMILTGYKNPLLSANWGIPTPDDVSPADLKAIELANKWFFEENVISFPMILAQIITMLEYGFSCFERVYQTWSFDNNMYLVPNLEQRLQYSIETIYVDENKVTQQTAKNGLATIPLDQMVFFTLKQQGKDMRGTSLLRPLVDSWKRKRTYMEYMGIGFQRASGGIPSMVIPKGTKVDSPEYKAVESLLLNFALHENAYMITEEGYDFNYIESTYDPSKSQSAIDAIDTKMALATLVQFLLLGQQGNGGAFALSRDQSDMFLDGLGSIVSYIETRFNRQVLHPMIKLNFGDTVNLSNVRLRGLNLNKKVGKELAEVLSILKASAFIKGTIEDEILLRKTLEMPDLSDEEIKKRREAEENPVDPTAPIIPTKEPLGTPAKEDEDDTGKVKNALKTKAIKFAEQKVADRNKLLDSETKQMQDFMQGHLLLIKEKLMADIKSMLNKGTVEIQGLSKIEVSPVRYRKALEMKLAGLSNLGWNKAKGNAKSNKIKLAESINPNQLPDKELKQYIINESVSISESQTSNMKNRAILTASNGPIKKYSIGQTLSNVDQAIDEFIKSNSILVSGSLVVTSSINFGENQFNKDIEDQLWGYRFVNADPVSEICQWYNGKTFSVDSVELSEAMAPLHPNCKSFLDPIYKSSEEQPVIDNVIPPPSIRKGKTIF